MELRKLHLNIPQLQVVIDNKIKEYEDMLNREIGIVGLREKVINRLDTMRKVKSVLDIHNDLNQMI